MYILESWSHDIQESELEKVRLTVRSVLAAITIAQVSWEDTLR